MSKINESEEVSLNHSLGTITYTKKELQQIISDFDFLQEVFLWQMNPKKMSKTDSYIIDYKEALKDAKKIFLNGNWNENLIKKTFKKYMKKITPISDEILNKWNKENQ